jgi:hypothetical protein
MLLKKATLNVEWSADILPVTMAVLEPTGVEVVFDVKNEIGNVIPGKMQPVANVAFVTTTFGWKRLVVAKTFP